MSSASTCQLGGLHVLGAEALDHPDPADGLLDHRGQLGLLGLDGEDRRDGSAAEKRWASTLTRGSGARASTASSGWEVSSSTTMATTIAMFEIVSGIITTKPWICIRSLDARLIS